MIVIVDFGSQTTHLIGRRIRDLGVKSEIVLPKDALSSVKKFSPHGIILSGGPSSVYDKKSPTISKKIFELQLPILGICYGQQLISHLLQGKVKQSKVKEYGPAKVFVDKNPLFKNIQKSSFTVWMSHGDEVVSPPKGFKIIAKSDDLKVAAISDEKRKFYAVQFHPEVQHTQFGTEILKNFLNICGEDAKNEEIDIEGIIKNIREVVGKKKVIMAFSGGTDSFVAGALIAKAIGKQLIPVYVESGLMRKQALHNVSTIFPKLFGFKPKILNARKIFLERLKDVTDPETKRKVIGGLYVRLFEKVADKIKNAEFLAQGTTYADFIHSKSTKHAALIKSHHNVGGLPKNMKLKLLEPIRYFYTDQVRFIGKKLGLPEEVIKQQPFPGPGFAVRIIGKITSERLKKEEQADSIVVE
jgi:GMP synthase (glutamine-hydrolysing)